MLHLALTLREKKVNVLFTYFFCREKGCKKYQQLLENWWVLPYCMQDWGSYQIGNQENMHSLDP